MTTYLVTGACGFIGSNFVHDVLRREPGATVVALDNMSFAANEANLDGVRDRVQLVVEDICNFTGLLEVYGKFRPDYVVNFAAESHNDRAVLDPSAFARTNALGAQILLEASRRHPVKRHLHVSTIEVYGELAEDAAFFTEGSPLNAKTPYSAAKAAGDQFVRAYMQTYRDMDIAMTHCANNYGRFQFPEKLVPLMITNVLRGKKVPVYGDGLQMRDWLHVSDHCAAIWAILHAPRVAVGYEAATRPELLPIYDISARNELTNMEIVERVLSLLGKRPEEWIEHVPDRPNHDRRYLIDPAKIETELGWKPLVGFDQGIEETVQWYVDHRPWWEAILARTGNLAFDWASGTASPTPSPSRKDRPPMTDTALPSAAVHPGPVLTRASVLADYRLGWESRHASLLGRREVLTGKGKFGIFGDGKELAQLAMARAAQPGDFRSGYYRDQTFMMAVGELTLDQFFAQLYADADPVREPASAGRQMNAHFATRLREADGSPRDLTARVQSAADMSPTAGQMPRLVGLGHASRLYRELPGLATGEFEKFSHGGNEIAFGTIGNASTAEGHFWETVNAIGVLRAAVLLSIWDDGYGISVANEHQICKADLSEMLSGFGRKPDANEGFELFRVCGWDYPALVATYLAAAERVRRDHVPAIVHVAEVTQPQGHSTSGSHERYKSAERLAFEVEFDGLRRMRSWMLAEAIAGEAELDAIEKESAEAVRAAQRRAWDAYQEAIGADKRAFAELAARVAQRAGDRAAIESLAQALDRMHPVLHRNLQTSAHEILIATLGDPSPERAELARWTEAHRIENEARYGSHLRASGARSPLEIAPVAASYGEDSPVLNGFEVLNACFDEALARMPNLVAFGEDVGKLGDVNQGFVGLQKKYGALRVSDTGIREQTIMGQAIGLALRGIRPIAEIQYLDYVLYGLQTLSDDLASLSWRTAGAQVAPVIVRTRGHRLEGIWHSGSQMGGLLHLTRGIWLCVPRNMTQAAGMYNTLLAADDPAIVVEVLNGYRHKERLPANVGSFRVPLGVPETLREGRDVTVVTYGACCPIVEEAAVLLARTGVDVEIVDVQTLSPFDREDRILASLKKTHRLVIVDEDVPGGASAWLMQQIVERMGGFWWLDAPPVTVTGREHRPAYGSDGDYFSKPSRDEIFRAIYGLMRDAAPSRYPSLF